MQEKPLTPYQKTQIAAAAMLGLAVTGAAGLGFALRHRVPVVVDAGIVAGAPLHDAVADRPAPAAAPAAVSAAPLMHATTLKLDKSWLRPAAKAAAKPSADDLSRERLLSASSGASMARVEGLRRQGLSWTTIARRLGWPKRSAQLFAKTGVLVGQRLARR